MAVDTRAGNDNVQLDSSIVGRARGKSKYYNNCISPEMNKLHIKNYKLPFFPFLRYEIDKR